ncbi:hypothetical protein [Bacillus sp. JJ783]|uniref:hypothetical protein n=1 Tax=Bacillus sp. JJ783 TaxID=3122974 RepID=UPI002FFE18E0
MNIINRVIVDSTFGDRSFLLCKGDLLESSGDGAIVITTYKNESGQIYGELVESIRQRMNIDTLKIDPFYHVNDQVFIGYTILQEGKQDKFVLTINFNRTHDILFSKEEYEELIEGVFATLAALEFSGYRFSSIALPVIGRKGLVGNYSAEITTLLEHATRWLKKSKYTKTIYYCIYLDEDVEIWNATLNQVLGRSIIPLHYSKEMDQIQKELLNILDSIPKSDAFWEDTFLPLRTALQRVNEIQFETLAAFGRKFAENTCQNLCELTGTGTELFDMNLRNIKNNNVLNRSMSQYMYGLRSFGNPAIHRTATLIGENRPTEEDIYVLLLMLRKILKLYGLLIYNQKLI